MATATLTRQQRVATLILALGPKVTGPLFMHLSDSEVETIAREVAHMGQVSQQQVDAVLRDFMSDLENTAAHVVGGPRVAREMIQKWKENYDDTDPPFDDDVDRLLGLQANRPFGYLADYGPVQLVGAIEAEHPQTIALIFGHLPSKQAAAVFTAMTSEVRAEVARRLATLEPVQPHVIRGVEQRLKSRLGPPRAQAEGVTIGGAREVATMLNAMARSMVDDVMERLEKRDPVLAQQIKEMMFVFEDITKLDDRAVQEVLRAVDPPTLALAMKGIDEEVAATIWRNLSERAGLALREELELMGAKPKSEIEGARMEVVKQVQKLADDGTIDIASGDQEEMIA